MGDAAIGAVTFGEVTAEKSAYEGHGDAYYKQKDFSREIAQEIRDEGENDSGVEEDG